MAELIWYRIRLRCRRPRLDSWVRKICWKRDRLPTSLYLGFSGGSAAEESTHNLGDLGSIPGLGRSPGEVKGCPLGYSGLENPMDCIVHGVAKSRMWLSHFHVQRWHKADGLREEGWGQPLHRGDLWVGFWSMRGMFLFKLREREKNTSMIMGARKHLEKSRAWHGAWCAGDSQLILAELLI